MSDNHRIQLLQGLIRRYLSNAAQANNVIINATRNYEMMGALLEYSGDSHLYNISHNQAIFMRIIEEASDNFEYWHQRAYEHLLLLTELELQSPQSNDEENSIVQWEALDSNEAEDIDGIPAGADIILP